MFGLTVSAAVPPTDLRALGELFKDSKAVSARISAYGKEADAARLALVELAKARAAFDELRQQQEAQLREREEGFLAQARAIAEREAALLLREQRIVKLEDFLDEWQRVDAPKLQAATERTKADIEAIRARVEALAA